MLRHYEAYADTGRDFIYFEFSSDHKAGSKANKQDAEKAFKSRTGRKVEVLKTYLLK